MNLAAKIDIAQKLLAQIDGGAPYTEGLAAMAHNWADEIRPTNPELAARLDALQ